MDQELFTYLDEQFREIRQRSAQMEEQVGGLRGEVGGLRGEMVDLRGEVGDLRQETRERFVQVEGQVSGLREEVGGLRGDVGDLRQETRERFEQVEGQLRDGIRQTQVMVEGVRDEVRILAEGMMGLDHRMGRTQIELNRKLDDLRTLVTPLYRRMDERVTHLEEREEQKSRDIMDVIRERYGPQRDS